MLLTANQIGNMTQEETLENAKSLCDNLTLEQKIELFKSWDKGDREELAMWADD